MKLVRTSNVATSDILQLTLPQLPVTQKGGQSSYRQEDKVCTSGTIGHYWARPVCTDNFIY